MTQIQPDNFQIGPKYNFFLADQLTSIFETYEPEPGSLIVKLSGKMRR